MSFELHSKEILPCHPVIIGDEPMERGSGTLHRHIHPANGQTR
jgi:hypothetical protein